MDQFDLETRRKNMSAIKSKETGPEIIVRQILHHAGLGYFKNYKDLAGTPDIYFSKRKVAVFVHGCFWHQHAGCKYASIPKSRTDYWIPKLERNVRRDRENIELLHTKSIRTIIIWECTIKKIKTEEDKIIFLNVFLEFLNDEKIHLEI